MITSSSQLKIASTPTIESISLSSAASALYAGGADASAPAVAVAIARCLRTSVGAPRDCRATHGLAAFALATSVLAMRGIHKNNNDDDDNFAAPSRPREGRTLHRRSLGSLLYLRLRGHDSTTSCLPENSQKLPPSLSSFFAHFY